jgi:hypothetical protein
MNRVDFALQVGTCFRTIVSIAPAMCFPFESADDPERPVIRDNKSGGPEAAASG